MERLEENPLRDRIRQANTSLGNILSCIRGALAGSHNLMASEIQAISEPLCGMDPIISRAAELRAGDMEFDQELKKYKLNLEELQTKLEQVRFMFLARQTHLVAAQDNLERVSLWAEALKQTQ